MGTVPDAQRALLRLGYEFDLESVTVLHVRRVVIGASGMRVLVAEEQGPSVVGGSFGDLVDIGASSTEERKMVEASQRPFVRSSAIRRLRDHNVRVGELQLLPSRHSWKGT